MSAQAINSSTHVNPMTEHTPAIAPIPSAYSPHNHQHCVTSALQRASKICKTQGVRLTATRERVLELVWQSHRALGAYDLMAELAKDGRSSAPPTVYRALEFLQKMGLVHRIASLNAFIGCPHPGEQHSGCFLICQQCQRVQEMKGHNIQRLIEQESNASGFSMTSSIIEVAGLCPNCQTPTDDKQEQGQKER